jgi:outer membrane protein
MIAAVLLATIASATPISLDEVRQQARNNPQALIAELERERAQQGVALARSAIYPRVSASAGAGGAVFGPQRIFSTVPRDAAGDGPGAEGGFVQRTVEVPTSGRALFDLNVTVSQLLYDGGRWWSQLAQAGALAEAEAGQLAEQRLASELEAVRRFYGLYSVQEARRLLEANLLRSEQLLTQAQALFEAGRAQRMDVYSAQVNLGNDRLELLRSEARLVEAQSRLALWLGHPGTQALEAVRPAQLEAAEVQVPSVDEALARAREQRPLLRSIHQRVRAAELEQAALSADRWPRVSAQVTAGRQGPSVDPFFTHPGRQNYVQGGLDVRWDLFTGFAHSAQAAQARLAHRRAELEAAQAMRELDADLRQAVVALSTQTLAVEIAAANLEAAREAQGLAQGRFGAGAGSTLEVRDAQLKLVQAELAGLQIRIDQEIARAALERTLGTGAMP